MRNYWTCSKFADWLRGTPKLGAATAEEWRDWHKTANRGFYESEAEKLKRIYTMVKDSMNRPDEFLNTNRKDFAIFVDEHDLRRGTDFLETFPELGSFYDVCRKLV